MNTPVILPVRQNLGDGGSAAKDPVECSISHATLSKFAWILCYAQNDNS